MTSVEGTMAPFHDAGRRLEMAEALLSAIPDFVYLFNSRTRTYVHSNRDLREFLGWSRDQVAHLSDAQFARSVAHPDEHETSVGALSHNRALVPGARHERRLRLRNGDGTFRWYSHAVTGFTFDEIGVVEALGTLHDITSLVESARRTEESEQRFRELFDRNPAGAVVMDDAGCILAANQALADLLGREVSDLVGSCYDEYVHPDEREDVEMRREAMAGTVLSAAHAERRLRHVDGSVRWVHVQITRVPEGRGYVTLLAFDDVTAQRAAQERLQHAATHDSLTGLPNRRLLADRVEQALVRARRARSTTAVLFLDLDRVKEVNDSLGHAAGDTVLATVAGRLADAVRAGDTVARVGGDEFVVVCEGMESPEELTDLADRVLAAVREPVVVKGETVVVTASIGIACSQGDATSDELVGAADRAMYEAKSSGRARFALAAPRL